MNRKLTDRRIRSTVRHGVSLLEVIACIVLLSVIIIPISGMMRSSARTMETAQGLSDESRSIDALRHMRSLIKTAQTFRTLGARGDRLEIVSPTGVVSTWRIQNRVLIEETNRTVTALIPRVTELQFAMIPRANPGPSGFPNDLAFKIERSNEAGNRTIGQTYWIEGPQ